MTAPASAIPADELAEDPRLRPPLDPREDALGATIHAAALANGATEAEAMTAAGRVLDARARRLIGARHRCLVCTALRPAEAFPADPGRETGIASRCHDCTDVLPSTLYPRPAYGRRA